MIDNLEMNRLMEKLENLADEQLASQLLRELTSKTKSLGQLVMNLDPNLSHAEWKAQCDLAREDVELVVKKIKSL